jgi:hypothetical protein
LLAFAVMQEPFLSFDYGFRPDANADLDLEILRWGLHRGPQVATEQGRTYPFYVYTTADNAAQAESNPKNLL